MAFISAGSIVRQAISLFFFANKGSRSAYIADIALEALTNESLTLENEVPQYPTEMGFMLSDNIVNSNNTLSISGVIGNASITPLSFEQTGDLKLQEIKDVLTDLYHERVPVTITTNLGVYIDYAITSLTMSQDGQGGYLNIDAEFKKIIIAETEETEVPEVVAKTDESGKKGTGANGKVGKTRKDAGIAKKSKPSPKVEEKIKNQSVLKGDTGDSVKNTVDKFKDLIGI